MIKLFQKFDIETHRPFLIEETAIRARPGIGLVAGLNVRVFVQLSIEMMARGMVLHIDVVLVSCEKSSDTKPSNRDVPPIIKI